MPYLDHWDDKTIESQGKTTLTQRPSVFNIGTLTAPFDRTVLLMAYFFLLRGISTGLVFARITELHTESQSGDQRIEEKEGATNTSLRRFI